MTSSSIEFTFLMKGDRNTWFISVVLGCVFQVTFPSSHGSIICCNTAPYHKLVPGMAVGTTVLSHGTGTSYDNFNVTFFIIAVCRQLADIKPYHTPVRTHYSKDRFCYEGSFEIFVISEIFVRLKI